MLEPVLVDTPTKFPQACFVCTGQTGPFIDWQAEKPGGLHLYTCSRCNRDSARVAGFAAGDRLEALSAALESFDYVERQIETLTVQLKTERDESELKDHAIDALKDELAATQGRVTQLEEQRQEAAKQLVA
jgi:hypothetical protein